MKANQNSANRFRKDDEAVSPVIAVILMVAITVVLAATVYVWVSGFGQSGEQAPAASFKLTNCDVTDGAEDFKVKLLSSSKSLQTSDLSFIVTYETNGTDAGSSWSVNGGDTTWDVGETIQIDNGGSDNIESDTYVIDIVHDPSGNIIGSPQYSC